MSGALIIVSGLPGSGKTTEARRLEAQRRGIRLSPDDWIDALGGNRRDRRLSERIERLQRRLCDDILRAGATAIVEWGTWTRTERADLTAAARTVGASVDLVVLDPPIETLWERIRVRGAEDPPIAWADLIRWSDQFERPDQAERATYDGFRYLD